MKTLLLLHNSYLGFGLDASHVYQPDSYEIFLIINEFGYAIVKNKNQSQYYKKIIVTNDFSFENILFHIHRYIKKDALIEVLTNSEETIPVCGQLRKFLHFDTEDYSRFSDKNIMKQRLVNSQNILVPKYCIFDTEQYFIKRDLYLKQITTNLKYPLFAKPIGMYSSVNLKKIASPLELSEWATSVKKGEAYEIDEFVDGVMYHCDSYIKDSKVLFTFVSQNSRPCYDFTIGKMKGTIVLPENNDDAILLAGVAERTLKDLGMPKAGVTHMEVIKKQNKIYFIEVGHRAPGCLIPKMYKVHSNIDTLAAHVLLHIDPDYYPIRMENCFAAWACYPKIPGRVAKLHPLPTGLSSTCELEWCVQVGDLLQSYSQFGRDYTGTLFMQNPDFGMLYQEFISMNNLNLCEISQ